MSTKHVYIRITYLCTHTQIHILSSFLVSVFVWLIFSKSVNFRKKKHITFLDPITNDVWTLCKNIWRTSNIHIYWMELLKWISSHLSILLVKRNMKRSNEFFFSLSECKFRNFIFLKQGLCIRFATILIRKSVQKSCCVLDLDFIGMTHNEFIIYLLSCDPALIECIVCFLCFENISLLINSKHLAYTEIYHVGSIVVSIICSFFSCKIASLCLGKAMIIIAL